MECSLGFLTRVNNVTSLFIRPLKSKRGKEKRIKSEVKRPAEAQSDSFKHQDLKPGTKRLT